MSLLERIKVSQRDRIIKKRQIRQLGIRIASVNGVGPSSEHTNSERVFGTITQIKVNMSSAHRTQASARYRLAKK